jgi:hypothetical protein
VLASRSILARRADVADTSTDARASSSYRMERFCRTDLRGGLRAAGALPHLLASADTRPVTTDRPTSPLTDLWAAAAAVRGNRRAGLQALENAFRAGSTPVVIDGPCRGRVLATTVGRGLDRPLEALASTWMPWKGKTFRVSEASGRNVFTTDSKLLVRVIWPRYHDVRPIGPGRYTAFRFDTSTGPSALFPEQEVFRIDYDVPDDPRFLIRRILDELVEVTPGVCLGQALLRLAGTWRRVAWFSLEV